MIGLAFIRFFIVLIVYLGLAFIFWIITKFFD